MADFLHLEHLTPPDPDENTTPVNKAIDVAGQMMAEALDAAQHVISHSAADRSHVLILASSLAQTSATVYAAHLAAESRRQFVETLRELFTELMGEISDAGIDIGAGVLGVIQQVLEQFNETQHHG